MNSNIIENCKLQNEKCKFFKKIFSGILQFATYILHFAMIFMKRGEIVHEVY
jgi:hypothetical protein